MSIDAPTAEATITTDGFAVSGWSIDRNAASGSGVDALHVYAYPNPGSGEPPIFLGVATQGIARPDVGALYGDQFGDSGYTLDVSSTVAGLDPGVYTIVVHSHSAVSGTFNNQASIRVTVQ